MHKKILSKKLFTSKKKAGIFVFCTAIVATLGVGTALAANSMNTLQVKMENGVSSYSTDDGSTWSQDVPDGVTVNEQEGRLTITKDVTP